MAQRHPLTPLPAPIRLAGATTVPCPSSGNQTRIPFKSCTKRSPQTCRLRSSSTQYSTHLSCRSGTRCTHLRSTRSPDHHPFDRLGLYKLLCGEERRALSLHCYSAVAIVIKRKVLFTNNNQPNYGTIILLNMILGAPSHHNKLDTIYVLFRSMYNIRST